MSTMSEKLEVIPAKFRGCSKNVWTEFAELVTQYNPINLGMGFPDYLPLVKVTKTFHEVISNENYHLHQYTRDYGHLRLVKAFSALYSKLLDREICKEKEILVSPSGSMALHTVIMGFIDKDDEVIIIEPHFDFYKILVEIAGGKCKFVPLRLKSIKNNSYCSSEWKLDIEALRNAFNSKTKLFILNTPNNPLGKVFSLKELSLIAELCKQWNVVCIADEVYEFFVYGANKHIRIASFPGMWERTLTVSCPGKTFGVTGWELGIIYGSENLVYNLKIVQQNSVHAANTLIQETFAILYEDELAHFNTDECFLTSLPEKVQPKRDFLVKLLVEIGMKPVIPEGGFFILADWSCFKSKSNFEFNSEENKDLQFAKWLIRHKGVAGIPMTAFYSEPNKHLGENFIRFCFLKQDETLQRFAKTLNESKA